MKKELLVILLFIATAFPSYSQQWSYDTLSEKKTDMNVAVIGNKIFFHSGNKKIGSSTVRVDKIDVFDVDNGTRETFRIPGKNAWSNGSGGKQGIICRRINRRYQ